MNWKRLVCKIKHHNLFKVRKLSDQSLLVGCKRCGNYYGINHSVRSVLPFDKEMCDMYKKVFEIDGLEKYICNDKLFDLFLG